MGLEIGLRSVERTMSVMSKRGRGSCKSLKPFLVRRFQKASVIRMLALFMLCIMIPVHAFAQACGRPEGTGVGSTIIPFSMAGLGVSAGSPTRSKTVTLNDGRVITITTQHVSGGSFGEFTTTNVRPAPKFMPQFNGTRVLRTTSRSGSSAMRVLISPPSNVIFGDGETFSAAEQLDVTTNGGVWEQVDGTTPDDDLLVSGLETATVRQLGADGRTDNDFVLLVSRNASQLDVEVTNLVSGGLTGFFIAFTGVDLGDAPASFGRARHAINQFTSCTAAGASDLRLGANFGDPDDPTITDTGDGFGDDNNNSGAVDDEDGIANIPSFVAGLSTTYTIPAADVSGSGTGTLSAWIDFDNSGTFETNEFASVPFSDGATGDLVWTGLPDTGPTATSFARFRVTSAPLGAGDFATDDATGEVEDYPISLEQNPELEDDSSSGNMVGDVVTLDVVGNDTGSVYPTSVSLITPTGATSVVTDADGDVIGFTVPGEGVWTVDETTGAVTFAPASTFMGDPTPVQYELDSPGGVTATPASVFIFYDQDEEVNAGGSRTVCTAPGQVPVSTTFSSVGGVATSTGGWRESGNGVVDGATYTYTFSPALPPMRFEALFFRNVAGYPSNQTGTGVNGNFTVTYTDGTTTSNMVPQISANPYGFSTDSISLNVLTRTTSDIGSAGSTFNGVVHPDNNNSQAAGNNQAFGTMEFPEIDPNRSVESITWTVLDKSESLTRTAVSEVRVECWAPSLETTKTIVSVSDPDSNGTDAGDTVTFEITVENTGDVELGSVTVDDTLYRRDGDDNNLADNPVLTLTSGPDFVSATGGSPEGTLEAGETATYRATYLLTVDDTAAGGILNTVTAEGTPPTSGLVSDVSDDGDDADGDTEDDPTVLEIFNIMAQDDTLTTPVDGSAGQAGVLNVLDSNGSGTDTVNGLAATTANVTIAPSTTNPPPAGITLNPDGTVDVAGGTPAGNYSFEYEICEAADPTNCDTATVTLTVGDAGIGVVKSSVFDDQNGDGNAQVGETITYSYTVTNEGDLDLTSVTLTETGFTGAGTAPTPILQSGDNGDAILQTTETWVYRASYALQQADIDAGQVDNSATASASTPGGSTVNDVSDSSNPGDGDGTGTPGAGPNNDDPTSTPLTSAPIVAQNDVVGDPLDATNPIVGAVDIFADNGNGTDTLNGVGTDATDVTVSPNPTNPVPAGFTLNSDGTVDIAAGTAPGTYTFGYEICETANSSNCDTATVTLTIGEGGIGVVKNAVFNDENGDGNGQVGETISYNYTVTNEGNLPLDNVSLTETGFTGNGATPNPILTGGDDGDGILQVSETWTYEVDYTLIASDLTDGGVDNQATAEGDTPGGTTVSDLSDSSNPADGDGTGTPGDGANNDDPTSTPLTTAPIAAQDDTLATPVDPTTTQTNVINVFDDNGSGPDTLNGSPTDETQADVEIVLTSPPPSGITLNPDGSIDIAAGTPPGTYTFDYEICEILNPDNCDTASVTLTVGEGQIAVVKDAVFNDDVVVDGNGQVGETISYTYTVTNPGDFDLANPTLTETGFTGAGTAPVPALQPGGDANGDGILQTTETWVYTATYTIVAVDLTNGQVDNQATASGDTPGGTTVSDLSDSTNPGDGDGSGNTGSGPGNDDPTSTPFTNATIAANNDILPDPVDASVPLNGVVNVLTPTGSGLADTLNGVQASTTGVDPVVISPDPTNPPPAGFTLDTTTGDVNIAAGTPPGTYTFGYEICELLNASNCDTATVEITIGEPLIGILKRSTFNDESLDGFAQVGETITYTYTVSNEGDLPLRTVNVTETAGGFTGAGTLPVPSFVSGDANGNSILDLGETWFYEADYTLVAADLTAGDVSNLASADATSPNGAPVSDLSDSQNPGDGNGTANPGDGPGNDDPTVTTLASAPIVANDDMVTGVDGFNGQPAAINVLLDNGGGPDTLGGTATNTGQVTISEVTPATPINGGPVPVLNPATGDVDVPAGTPAGSYQITYEICETLNPDNCDTATATIDVAAPVIDAVDDTFTAAPFDGAGGDTTPSVFTNDTLDTFPFATTDVNPTITNDGGLSGAVINPDGTITIPPGTPAGTYPVTYQICDVVNPTNCDTATATIQVGTISAQPETFDTVNGATGGTTPSVLGSDLLSGAPITNPADVVLTVTGATGGLTLDPATNGIIVPPGTPAGSYTLTYQICDTTNPTICSTVTETVQVGTILAVAESFPATPPGGTTTVSILDSDLLNGNPATPATVDVTVISADPGLTLNPDGTVTIAPGTPAGPLVLTYQICDVANPTICSTIAETINVAAEPAITAVKTQVLVDNGDGIDGAGDRLDYTITVTNDGNIALTNVIPNDTLTDGNGNTLVLDSGPTFDSSSAGSPEGTLAIGETATYLASYTLQNDDVTSGLVSNIVLAQGEPLPPAGYVGPPLSNVSDISDEGNAANGADDPTVFTFLPNAFVDGVSVRKIASVSTVQRGGVVPYIIEVTNDNPALGIAAITVDTLPQGFVLVDGSATIDGVPTTAVDVVGRVVSFPTLILPAGGSATIELSARVLTGAPAGDAVNTANILDASTGAPLAPAGTATVRIEPEAVFDCGDVIGKVYDDANGNGYQDQGEKGLPSVRIAGVDGTIITTDVHGRYHVPCAMLPETRGSNFILKVDERSLPTGYRITTENPRVIRLTRGKMKEMNFGASISQVVRVDINSRVFGLDDDGKMQLVPAFKSGMETLLKRIKDKPSTVRVAFHVPHEATDAQIKTGRKMARDVKRYIRQRWRRIGDYKLNIETTIVRRK